MVVVDASAILEILLKRARAVDLRARLSGEKVNAPHLIDVEVMHVLRRYALSGDLDEARARKAIADHMQTPIERHGHESLLGVVWQLRDNFTAYDGMYVALGVALRATLITTDLRLARAAESILPVEVFA